MVQGKFDYFRVKEEEVAENNDDEDKNKEMDAGEHNGLLLLVVRLPPEKGKSPIYLFQEKHSGHAVH
jgi:hypothetical protein